MSARLKKTLIVFAAIFLAAASPPRPSPVPDAWIGPATEAVVWFETSGQGYGTLAPDFDCQGLSGGALQWNVGSGSLWKQLFRDLPAAEFTAAMPTYGTAFRNALAKGPSTALAYVRQFQSYTDKTSCHGSLRKAKWSTPEGKAFAREVRALLIRPIAVERQQAMVRTKLAAGWRYAGWWAADKRGAGATPTYLEFLVFTDTLNFNGEWRSEANYSLVRALRAQHSDAELTGMILDFLGHPDPSENQIKEARANANLWAGKSPDSDQLDLLTFSYLIAANLRTDGGKAFKRNTLSRRGTIIFNDGWVNGERKSFSVPAL